MPSASGPVDLSWVISQPCILKVAEDKPISEIDDQTLIMADLSMQSNSAGAAFCTTLLKDAISQPVPARQK